MDGAGGGGEGVGWGVIGGVVERHSTQYSFLSFLHTVVFFFLSSPFTSPSVGVKRVRQKKKKERETGVHLSCKETTTASFLSPVGGP